MATATPEKPRPSGGLDVKLESLRRGVSMRRQARDKLVDRIAQTREREERTVATALETTPKIRAYKQDSAASVLKDELSELEDDLQDLETELSALEPLLKEQVDLERKQRIDEVRETLTELGAQEIKLWQQGDEIVDELLTQWSAYVEVLEQRSYAFHSAISDGVLSKDDGEYAELEALARGPVWPACGSIASFTAKILDVTIDPDNLSYRDPHGRPADQDRKLVELLSDKRTQLRKLEVSGGLYEIR